MLRCPLSFAFPKRLLAAEEESSTRQKPLLQDPCTIAQYALFYANIPAERNRINTQRDGPRLRMYDQRRTPFRHIREYAFHARASSGGCDAQDAISIDAGHSCRFSIPVILRVLDYAKRIYPQISEFQVPVRRTACRMVGERSSMEILTLCFSKLACVVLEFHDFPQQ
jgi:hypothetical protein